jgi:pimeloyl-ACP methyl ester carboxylesterase
MTSGNRRNFLGTVVTTFAAGHAGVLQSLISTGKELPAVAKPRNPGISSFPGTIKQIVAGALNVGYVDEGSPGDPPVLLLHGWPYDIHSYEEVAPILVAAGYRVIIPYLRGYGTTRFLDASAMRNGQQSVFAVDMINFMNALGIRKAVIGGFDWGARTAAIMAALWPQRCKAMVAVSGYLIGNQVAGRIPLQPANELQWWYQYYFATERGRMGYEKFRTDFAKLIWQIASPEWKFSDAVFNRTAASFNNPDHVAIVIHNYRWRLGLEAGEQQYDHLENELLQAPVIKVPAITLESDANGAPHPPPASYAAKFKGKYLHRTVEGGVGHNLPQEAPKQFAEAIIEVDQFKTTS